LRGGAARHKDREAAAEKRCCKVDVSAAAPKALQPIILRLPAPEW
jgi:hypothetical protein